jgi:proteasome lid subunit RPN8/RPN11
MQLNVSDATLSRAARTVRLRKPPVHGSSVVVDRRVLAAFRRRAWKAFPNEHVEIIVGQGTEIHGIHPIEYISTPNICFFDFDDELELLAKQVAPLRVLGSIHTHPGHMDASPSEHDWESLRASPERITGICAMWEAAKGRRSRIKFYHALAPFTIIEVI